MFSECQMFFLKKIFGLRERSFLDEEKPFMSHLEDLRSTLLKMAITLVIAMGICFSFAPTLLDFLRSPVENVWLGFENSHLPSEVKSRDWLEAKKLASMMPELTDKARTALLARESDEMRELVECVSLLKAVNILPSAERDAFLEEAATSPQIIEKVKRLKSQDALLQIGDSESGFRMMSTLHPTESFNLSLKLAFFAGIVVSFPLLCFFGLEFILPGLKESERRVLFRAMIVGVGLFLTGVSFAYFVVLPGILDFFFTYSMNMGISNDWRIGFYLNFVVQFLLLFGLSFELPVVVMPFVKLGVLTYDMMKVSRNYAILIIAILSAVLTPADVLSMVLMAVPMYALYEACIFLAWREHKKEMQREQESKREVEKWEQQESPYDEIRSNSSDEEEKPSEEEEKQESPYDKIRNSSSEEEEKKVDE